MPATARNTVDNPPDARTRGQRLRGAEIVVRGLLRLGLRRFFGVPGGAISPVADALLDVPEAEVLFVRHEAEAVFAACGQWLVAEQPGVAFVTSGPGFTNALTGLASALCDGVPMVLLVGEVPRAAQGRGALQDGSAHHLNVAAVSRSLAKACWEAPSAHALPSLIVRAVHAATSGRPGPVVITLPLDVQTATALDAPPVCLVREPAAALSPEMHGELSRVLDPARRAVVFAGAGLRGGDGPAALLAFAERWQIPVMSTPKGKGVFPESHPLALGVFGIGGHPSASAWLREGIDVLLAVGTSLGDLATEGWSDLLVPRQALIHVDVDGAAIGRHYATSHAVIADGASVLRRLCEGEGQPRPRVHSRGVTWHSDPSIATDGTEQRIGPARALWELQQALPADAIWVIDSGEHFLFAAHYLRVDRPDCFVAQTGLGSMGCSLGAAIGAQRARPSRRVVAVIGDGGFGMVAPQISDAVAAGLPITVCVINDERLTMCELGHLNVYGRTPSFATPAVDVVAMARALGADAIRVEHTGEITAHGARVQADRPLVIDVRIDRSFKLPKKDRIGALGRRG